MTSDEMKEILVKGGFKRPNELIQVLLGGSDQHGAKLAGKGDIDVNGVYIEHPHRALGIGHETHFTGGTSDQYERNKAGDEDYKVYTLQRWAGLAVKGNPTVLGFLFSPNAWKHTVWASHIVPNQRDFMASSHASAFIGFATSQISRLDPTVPNAKGKGKHGQRPELEAIHGYDVKAAMHCIRMMYECEEFLRTGVITYPRPEKDLLIDIRLGKYTIQEVLAMHHGLEQKVRYAEDNSPLPPKVNRDRVSYVIAEAYIQHWRNTFLI